MALTEAVPRVLFFLGPMELAIVGIILLVLLFGSKAPEMAGRMGESVSKVEQPKRKLEGEIEDLKGTPDEVREDLGIDDDLEEIQDGVEDVQEGIDPDGSVTDRSDRSGTSADDNV